MEAKEIRRTVQRMFVDEDLVTSMAYSSNARNAKNLMENYNEEVEKAIMDELYKRRKEGTLPLGESSSGAALLLLCKIVFENTTNIAVRRDIIEKFSLYINFKTHFTIHGERTFFKTIKPR